MSGLAGPTWNQVHTGGTEYRRYLVCSARRTAGLSAWAIQCPFCHARITAYVFSLSGVGKRCDCGALMDASGGAFHFKGATP